ncbi:cysteine proteinase [Microthyrium microscopicum]|uniref:Cysteine proteinase n=1 Tax=Microthyrium microscopicum TaxID=703497 RepID=A0A6A6U5V1_9PEZI|nr:cysteine proteinase [Microthyrium microscopicum]
MTTPAKPKKKVRDAPQKAITNFWSKFLSPTPSRATQIFPPSLYQNLLPANLHADGAATYCNAADSYEAAAQECRERVARVVRECKRTNEKFTDSEFDIEWDLRYGEKYCLEGLAHDEEDGSSGASPPGEGVTGCKSSSSSRPGGAKRVGYIYKKPQFAANGFSEVDIRQGKAGDCWWLAAVGTLCSVPGVMEKVCVARNEACGVYGFVFYRDGEWVSTVVDDMLYVRYKDWSGNYDPRGEEARKYRARYHTGSDALFFASCEDQNETWLPLLEKAFAKIHGDYDSLEGGWMGEAVEDMSGGVTTAIRCDNILDPDELWQDMVNKDKNFLFALSSRSSGAESEPWKHGLRLCHAYSILRAVEEKDEDGKSIRLVQIRNPWGHKDIMGGGEWDGPFSDGSPEWNPYWLQKLDYRFGNNGIFWMPYEDMLREFDYLDRTRLFNEEWQVVTKWTSVNVSWVSGYLKKKFMIEVTKEGHFVIVLSKLDERYFRGLEGQYKFTLNFLLRKQGTKESDYIVRARGLWRDRSISAEVDLEPGTYEVIPQVIAQRYDTRQMVEDQVKKFAESKPQKLRQIGMNHDMAVMKGNVPESETLDVQTKDQEDAEKEEEPKELSATQSEKSEESKENKETDENNDSLVHKSEAEESNTSDKHVDNSDENAQDESQTDSTNQDSSKEDPDEKEKVDEPIDEQSSKDDKSDEDNKSDGKSEDWEQVEKGSQRKPEAPQRVPAARRLGSSLSVVQSGPSANSARSSRRQGVGADGSGKADDSKDADEEVIESPWNAVCVMGLRVYSMDKGVQVTIGESTESEGEPLQTTAGATT